LESSAVDRIDCPSAPLELVPEPPVDVGPLALRPARRELSREPIVVQPLDETVNPSETERLAQRILIRDRRDAGVILVKDEPHAGARRVMLREPGPPLTSIANVQLLELSGHDVILESICWSP
jgi:hypothetical protein